MKQISTSGRRTGAGRSRGVMPWAAIALAALLSACGSGSTSAKHSAQAASASATPRFSGTVGELIAQAAKEGELDVSWSSSFADNGRALGRWADAFNKFYGLDLKFSASPAPTMPQMASKIVQEAEAGSPAATDVFIGASVHIASLIKGHALRAYDWPRMAKEIGITIPQKAIAPGNFALAFATEIYGIVYDSARLAPKSMPQTLAAVLAPKWKGRVASTPYASGFYQLAVFSKQWGPARTTAYVRKLSHQIGGLMRGGDPTPILSGQFDMLVLSSDISDTILAQRKNQPLGYIIPKDAPVVDYWNMAVPKTSQHPAAAALLTLFMLTPQGQALSWDTDGNDLILLPNSHDSSIISSAAAYGGTVADYVSDKEVLAYHARYARMLSHPGS